MSSKTIFINDNQMEVYNSKEHNNNHRDFIDKYYKNLKITEYIPILLSKKGHCIIDLSKPYKIGTIYLPQQLTDFQKNSFEQLEKELEFYTLYLSNHSLIDPVKTNELLMLVKLMPQKRI